MAQKTAADLLHSSGAPTALPITSLLHSSESHQRRFAAPIQRGRRRRLLLRQTDSVNHSRPPVFLCVARPPARSSRHTALHQSPSQFLFFFLFFLCSAVEGQWLSWAVAAHSDGSSLRRRTEGSNSGSFRHCVPEEAPVGKSEL